MYDLEALTEGADSSNNTKRLAVRPGLHVLGNLQNLTLEQLRRSTSRLSNLQTTEHVTLCIRESLSLLKRDTRRQAIPILPNQVHKLEHDSLPMQHSCILPREECLLSALHRSLHLLVRVLGHSGDKVVGRWVGKIDVLVSLGLDELVVEEVRRVLDG